MHMGEIMALVGAVGGDPSLVDLPSTSLKSILLTSFATLLAGGVSLFIYRRNKPSNALEDATNNLTVETLNSQATRLAEKDARIKTLESELESVYDQLRESRRGLINAETEAMVAQSQARIAAQAAETASRAANRAKLEVAHIAEYTRNLQGILEQQKISYPPLPPLPDSAS